MSEGVVSNNSKGMGLFRVEAEFIDDRIYVRSGLAIGRVNPISRPDPNWDFRYPIVFGPWNQFL